MDCCRKTGNHGRWNCSLRCEMSCICFVLSILYKDRIFLFCTCILSYLQRCICAVSVLYLCWNCRLRWGMTQALPLIDALTTLGWRLTSVGPPRLAAKDDQSLWSNFKWNPSSWWRGKEVGFNFDLLCIYLQQREWGGVESRVGKMFEEFILKRNEDLGNAS